MVTAQINRMRFTVKKSTGRRTAPNQRRPENNDREPARSPADRRHASLRVLDLGCGDHADPACCTTRYWQRCSFTSDLLTRHTIFHWLDYGSLLGAVRDGRFCSFLGIAMSIFADLFLRPGYEPRLPRLAPGSSGCRLLHVGGITPASAHSPQQGQPLACQSLPLVGRRAGGCSSCGRMWSFPVFPPAYLAKLESVQLEGGLYARHE